MSGITEEPSGSEPDRPRRERREVRGIADADWEIALAAAQRADLPVGKWLTQAIRAQLASEHEPHQPYDVLPPAPERAMTLYERPTLDQIAQALDIAQAVAAARGKPVPRRLLSRVNQLIGAHLGCD